MRTFITTSIIATAIALVVLFYPALNLLNGSPTTKVGVVDDRLAPTGEASAYYVIIDGEPYVCFNAGQYAKVQPEDSVKFVNRLNLLLRIDVIHRPVKSSADPSAPSINKYHIDQINIDSSTVIFK